MQAIKDILAKHRAFTELVQRDPEAAQKQAESMRARDEAQAAIAREEHLRQQWEALAEHLARSGLEKREIEWITSHMSAPASPPEDAVAKFVRDESPFLLLFGGVGSGKTTAASRALMSDLCKRPYDAVVFQSWTWSPERCRFKTAFELSRLSYYGEGADALKALERLDLLVVDDLGAEFMPEGGAWRATFDQLTNARYRKKTKTILTTNLDLPTFKARYGERCYSRIAQEGTALGCGLTDLRLRK